MGAEASGIVDEIGDGVSGVVAFGFGDGTVSEKAIFKNWAAKPAAVFFEVAAGLPVIVDTASRALNEVNIERNRRSWLAGRQVVEKRRLRGITVIASYGYQPGSTDGSIHSSWLGGDSDGHAGWYSG